MKWLLAIGLAVLSLFTGSYPYGESAGASDRKTSSVETKLVIRTQTTSSGLVESLFNTDKNYEPTLLELDNQRLRQIEANTEKIESVVAKLKSRVGKTWYVFSGSTPSGWDCSGLVYWAYEQLGVPVEHSANKQGNSGTKVRTPKVGDIVVFGYKGSKTYYHSSIYIGDGKVIHAGFRKGTSTSIIALDDPSFRHSTATFIRLIESN
jgi:hypothetical protein